MTVKSKKHVEVQTTKYIMCDVCGKNVDHANFKNYQVDQVGKIWAAIGEFYPDWDCRTTYTLDICGPCFMSKIKPAIETVVKFREYRTDDEEPFITDGEVHSFPNS